MRPIVRVLIALCAIFAFLLLIHLPLLRLPYFWDEAGYYIPAAVDFYRHGRLIPHLTLPTGHTPLIPAYIGVAWRIFGFSELTARAAMVLVAAGALIATYAGGNRVAGRETGLWAAGLLAISPLFYAQSSLVFLDLAAALFTTLAVLFALDSRWRMFALAASLAVLSKETAIVLLPAIWVFMLFRRKERRPGTWALTCIPLVILATWSLYYHGHTGYWTGNAGYLQYNLYSAFTPLHIARSLVARLAEILFQGFDWILAIGAALGIWWARKRGSYQAGGAFGDFLLLAIGLIVVYIAMLSVVGGAILPRYMLPVLPVCFIIAVAFIRKLPRRAGQSICVIAAACFIAAWFINPPYPFPYEDNISYADFIHLHQKAANYLETLPGNPIILTAWPATDELRQPFLGYVSRRLRVAPVDDFKPSSFVHIPRFDVLYLYSRQWNPPHNLMTNFAPLRAISGRFYDYEAPVRPTSLAARLDLKLIWQSQRRGQWVRIYAHCASTAAESRLCGDHLATNIHQE